MKTINIMGDGIHLLTGHTSLRRKTENTIAEGGFYELSRTIYDDSPRGEGEVSVLYVQGDRHEIYIGDSIFKPRWYR